MMLNMCAFSAGMQLNIALHLSVSFLGFNFERRAHREVIHTARRFKGYLPMFIGQRDSKTRRSPRKGKNKSPKQVKSTKNVIKPSD